MTSLFACAAGRVAVRRMAPAKYDITGVGKIGLLNFYPDDPSFTNGAHALTTVVENKLIENGFFDVTPRVNRYEGAPIQTSPVILPDFLAKVGAAAGVDALVFGIVNYYGSNTVHGKKKIEEEVSTGRYRTERYAEDGVVKTRQVEIKEKKVRYEPTAERSAGVIAKLYALRTANAKYIGRDELKQGKDLTAEGQGEIDDLPSEQYMLSEATDRLAAKFVNNITPHEVTEFIKLKTHKTCKAGVKLAKAGDWQGAIDAWDEELRTDPNNDIAMYDLGVAYEYQRNYQRAREFYRDAMRISNKPLYNEAWVRIHDIIQQNEKLEKQLKGREQN
jgi:tetratricopeptide (TPR) repeat protein